MVLNGIEREPAADEKEAPPAENVDRDRWGPLHGTSDGEKSATHRKPRYDRKRWWGTSHASMRGTRQAG